MKNLYFKHKNSKIRQNAVYSNCYKKLISSNQICKNTFNQSHRTKLPYFRNELVEKSVNGQNWQTGQSYFLAIYVYKNLKSSLQMMEFI